MRQADSRRLDRLAGDGTSEAGINLASLFRVILDQVQDSADGVSQDALIAPAQGNVSNHARVEHWYHEKLPGADPWKALVADALDQLKHRGLLEPEGDRWKATPKFVTGKRLVVIPERNGKHGPVGVIVHDAAERETLAAAETKRMEVTSLAASLREDGPGLRPLNQEHVAVLEQSMRDYGYRPEFPPLSDQHGRILDGRHRIAAARRVDVPVPSPRIVKVNSDEEAVGFAILVNLQRGWTKDERKRIDSDLQAAGLTLENFGSQLGASAKRERIRAALLEQANLEKPLSHNAIAKQLDLGSSGHVTVGRVCQELIVQCTYSECPHRFTEDGKEAPGPKPKQASAAEEQVEELLLENPQQSNRQILTEVGLTPNQHRVVERARERLESEGAIPVVTAREGSDGTVRHVPNAAPLPPAPPPPPCRNETPRTSRPRPSNLMQRIARLLTRWESDNDDPSSELEELEALRREVDERIATLRG